MANDFNIFRDQMHREVLLARCPLRMVSLVPSISELLFDLGLDERVVGITKFCVHPAHGIKTKTIVGGTKTLKVGVISALAPDLILGAKEENDREQIERLMEIAPVYMADVKSIYDAILLIQSLGEICGIAETSRQLSEKIKDHLPSIHQKTNGKVAYLIWQQPLMCAGVDTYIHSVLTWMGYENVATALTHSRYPEISWEELREMSPDKVFLSSEPFPFKDNHIAQFKKHLPDCDIRCVDGEMFSWYGSRMLRLKIPNEHDSV
jgi:ABC-type Fe3+-hydroxamate transport system substrate-binding protein